MAKAIKWQIQFVSNNLTAPQQYRIDIYAEGYSGQPIQLTGGPQPFVTEEDKSFDYFQAVRAQSGTIQVCTHLENGEILDINTILPPDNLAHPVHLVNVSNNNSIEWIGFLSCEEYSQAYTGIAEILSLNVISVLEAMDSVEIDPSGITGTMRGNYLLYQILHQITDACGMTMFTNVAYSRAAWRILNMYFDAGNFFESKENINENTVSYTVVGTSCKKLLERLCVYMGWTARERGRIVYLQRMGEEVGMYYQSLTNLNKSAYSSSLNRSQLSIVSANIANLEWMGCNHKIDARQGAKSVEVIANISNYDAGMGLPDFPGSNPTTAYTRYGNKDGDTPVYVENILEQDNNANNRCTYSYHYGYCMRRSGGTPIYRYDGTSTQSDFMTNSWLRGGLLQRTYDGNNQSVFYAGAALIKYAEKATEQETASSTEQGLYCTFLPGLMDRTDLTPIFTMKNPKPISLLKGALKVSADMTFIGIVATRSWSSYNAYQDDLSKFSYNPSILMKLRVGNKYWDGSAWVTTDSTFTVECSGTGIEISIPVSGMLFGESELSILPVTTAGPQEFVNESQVFEAIFKSLELSYTPDSSVWNMDRSSNNYYRNLGTKFRDEVSISTEFASYANNVPSPSLIIEDTSKNDASRFMDKLTYNTNDSTTVLRRPEVDLLNRLATYYGAARQTLDLIVKHPTEAALSLLKLNGINDNKKYLPLAESRNWKTEECTLTCFETPN